MLEGPGWHSPRADLMETPEPYAHDPQYSLGTDDAGNRVSAEALYRSEEAKRQSVCDMARMMAELTEPAAFPPEGYKPGDRLPGNNQSVGTECLNTLTAALLMLWFPPSQPMFRLVVKRYNIAKEIRQNPALFAETLVALAELEVSHRDDLKSTQIATAAVNYIKQLLLSGNACWRHIDLDTPTVHRCDSYIVKRNKQGAVLLGVLKECQSLQSLDADHREFILERADEALKDKPAWEQEVDIYSCQKLKVGHNSGEKSWCYWEEWEGHTLPGTEVEVPFKAPVMHFGWLVPCYGEDWGGGYCEAYRGDLFTVEAHASALNDGASLAALSLMFVKPGSSTSLRQIQRARNLSMLPGQADDVSVFRSDKTADFNFVVQNYENATRRLSRAFLLQFSAQRQGERVTAEEFRTLSRELDKAMGGLHTQMAQGNQRPIIYRAVLLNEEANPKLPTLESLGDMVGFQIITGIEALGDSTEGDNLVELAGTTTKLFPIEGQKQFNVSDFVNRLGATKGIRTQGLTKSPAQIAQEDQKQMAAGMAAEVVSKGTAPTIQGLAAAAQPQPPAAAQGG